MASSQQQFNDKSLLRDFFDYLYHPIYQKSQFKGKKHIKFRHIFKLWSFVIVITAIIGAGLSLALSFLEIGELNNSIMDLFMQQPLHVFLLVALAWAPITEELTFRLALRYSPWRLAISLAFVVVLIVAALGNWLAWDVLSAGLADIIPDRGIYLYLASVAILSFVLAYVFKVELPEEKVQNFYTKRFSFIFYFSVIIFAVIHIFNFYNITGIWHILPLLVLPQLLFGVWLGYTRMRYGIGWSIVGHCLHNGMVSLPLIFISFMPADYIRMVETGKINEQMMIPEASLISLVFSLLFIGIAISIFVSVIKLIREYFVYR